MFLVCIMIVGWRVYTTYGNGIRETFMRHTVEGVVFDSTVSLPAAEVVWKVEPVGTVKEEKQKQQEQQEQQQEQQEQQEQEAKEGCKQSEQVLSFVERMSVEEKIGQVFMVALTEDYTVEELFDTYHVGGIILFQQDMINKEQTQAMITAMQEHSELPLWIGVDEEGGRVSRVGKNTGIVQEPFLAAATLGATQDCEYVYEEARRMGRVLVELGINMDFAPVADIFNNPANTVIGTRSFGTTKEAVIPMVISFAKGLKDEGIMPVIKHFPGHGNTMQDSHEELAYIDKSLAELEQEEMIPFDKAIESGVDAMLLGHLIVEAVDPTNPVTLSSTWGEYINERYDEDDLLIMTDALNMGAITKSFEPGEEVVQSFISGCDVLLMPQDLDVAYKAMLKAYEEGRITDERLNESVRKILLKKEEQKLLLLE